MISSRLPALLRQQTAGFAIATLFLTAGAIAQDSATGPSAVAEQSIIDLGSVARGQERIANFQIRNDGQEDLTLRVVRSTCACAVAEIDRVVAPGETGKVDVKLDTSMLAGPSQAQVILATNDPDNQTLTLTVKVLSRSYLSAEPGYYRFNVHQNFPGTGIVEQTVWSNDGAEFSVTGVRTELRAGGRSIATSATFRKLEDDERRDNTPGAQWRIMFELPKDAPVGGLAGWVRVDTDHPQQTTAHLPITGFMRPIFSVTPAQPKYQYIQSRLAEEPYQHELFLKNFAEESIDIIGLRTDVEGLRLDHEAVDPGREYLVQVIATGGLPKGEYTGTLFIETSSEMSGTIEVPLQFNVQ